MSDDEGFKETSDVQSLTAAEEPEILQERIRTLRLWADHLESLLAQRSNQLEIWRTRAEERKERIIRLESVPRRSWRQRVRAWTRRPAQSAPAVRSSVKPPVAPAVAARFRSPKGVAHPTVRIAVIAPAPSEVPPLVDRMNSTVVDSEDSAGVVHAADLLIVVGDRGVDLAKGWEATQEWIRNGHPTIAVSASLPGAVSIDEASLTYFDESDDVFSVSSDEQAELDPELDPDFHPTLSRLHLVQEDGRALDVQPEGRNDADRERQAVAILRRMRAQSSPQAVGAELLTAGGVPMPTWKPEALAVCVSRRPDMVTDAVRRMTAQSYRPLRLGVALQGEAAEAEATVRNLLDSSEIPHLVLIRDASTPQGGCLNDLVAAMPGDVVLKIDDDDLYSTVYLEDMMGALDYSGADITGKASAFYRLQRGDMVLMRGGHYEPVNHVIGSTITARRSAWEAVRFPHRHERVDSKFLQAARAMGLSIVSHHPWDFCVIRHEGNTWTASDDYFASAGRAVDIDWSQMQTSAG